MKTMFNFWKRCKFRLIGKDAHIILCEKTWKKGEFIIRCYGPGIYAREYLVVKITEDAGGWNYHLKYLDV